MKLTGAAVLEALSGADTLRDAMIRGVEIGDEDDRTFVRLRFSGRSGSRYGAIELTMRDIVEYGFYDSGELGRHSVAMLKLFAMDDGGFYISVDPFDENTDDPAEQDNYFVQASSIEAVLTQR
jgi:hypothetical protein